MESDFVEFVEFSKQESHKFKELKHFFRCLIAYSSMYLPLSEKSLSDKSLFIKNELDPAINSRISVIYDFFNFSDFNHVSKYLYDYDWWWKFITKWNEVGLTPYHLSYFHETHTERERKKSTGRYFSPREQVAFICKSCLYESLLTDDERGIEENVVRQLVFHGSIIRLTGKDIVKLLEKISQLSIVDPSCGCGTFLYEMGKLISSVLDLLLKNGHISAVKYNETLESCLSRMRGYDIDSYNVRITKFSIVHLWNQKIAWTSYGKTQNLTIDLNLPANIRHSDFVKDLSIGENSVDIICTNPPFIRHHEFKKHDVIELLKSSPELNLAFKGEKFEIDAKGDIYLYFILKSLLLLKPKGVFGFILSRSWYSSRFSTPMFQLLNGKYFWLKLILETPYEPWQNAEIRTNITIGQKHSGNFVRLIFFYSY